MNNISTFFYQIDSRSEESSNLFNLSDFFSEDSTEYQLVWQVLDELEFSPSDFIVNEILEKSRNL
jgi:hypothetical protein